jgi:hypothetical protein
MKTFIKTISQAALMASVLLLSGGAFAQVSADQDFSATMNPAELDYASSLQKEVHVVCHVTKGPRSASITEVELTVSNSKAKVAVSYLKPDHTRTTKTFSDRDWSVTESYDDYSNEIQYETLVNLTDDAENFLLVQFYSSKKEARGVLQVGPEAYDLLCK